MMMMMMGGRRTSTRYWTIDVLGKLLAQGVAGRSTDLFMVGVVRFAVGIVARVLCLGYAHRVQVVLERMDG